MRKIYPAILAGAAIALGSIIQLSCPYPILGAFLFSIGLLVVRDQKYKLVTGQTQFLSPLKNRRIILPTWLTYLLFNVIGVSLMYALTLLMPDLNSQIKLLAQSKFSSSWNILLFQAIACGALMSIATHINIPLWVSTMCVGAFIICGFHHCVADVLYVIASPSWIAIGKWLIVVLGNLIGGYIFA